MTNKKQKNKNIYKITTLILLGIIITFGIIISINYYGNYKYEKGIIHGEERAISTSIKLVEKNGYVTFFKGNNNITLVDSSSIQKGQEAIISEIINLVETKGYVPINKGNSSLILVPYKK